MIVIRRKSLNYLWVIALLAGCVTPVGGGRPDFKSGVFERATLHDDAPDRYIIDPPDRIHVVANNIREINGTFAVATDEQVEFPLLGKAKLSGLTRRQAEMKVIEMASKFYVHPKVKIEVIANSKFFPLFGGEQEVWKLPYTGSNSVLRVMLDAGMKESAWPAESMLIRPKNNGHPARVLIDFARMKETGDLSQNYRIEAGDILYICLRPYLLVKPIEFDAALLIEPFFDTSPLHLLDDSNDLKPKHWGLRQ